MIKKLLSIYLLIVSTGLVIAMALPHAAPIVPPQADTHIVWDLALIFKNPQKILYQIMADERPGYVVSFMSPQGQETSYYAQEVKSGGSATYRAQVLYRNSQGILIRVRHYTPDQAFVLFKTMEVMYKESDEYKRIGRPEVETESYNP